MPLQGFVSSSEIAALFGLSPYNTPYQVWAYHARGVRIEADADERIEWGIRLQDDILAATAATRRWDVEPNDGDKFVRHADATVRAGATVDAFVRNHERGLGVVEAKNLDRLIWLNDWTDTEAPAHIELQLQHQLLVTGARWGCIAALVGGNELKLYEREPRPKVHAAIIDQLAGFWARIDKGDTPDPSEAADDRNLDALAALFPLPTPKSVLDMRDDEAIAQAIQTYQWAVEQRKFHTKIEHAKKAEILATMQSNEVLRATGYRVTASRGAGVRITVKEVAGDPPIQHKAPAVML